MTEATRQYGEAQRLGTIQPYYQPEWTGEVQYVVGDVVHYNGRTETILATQPEFYTRPTWIDVDPQPEPTIPDPPPQEEER